MSKKDKRWCLICNPRNRTIYFHKDEKTGLPWLWCNKCDRGYSLEQYCQLAGISIDDFIGDGIDLAQEVDNEVNVMAWPSNFVPLSDPRAQKGVEYIKSRGLSLDGDMYYDLNEEGIVFPYYFENHFCGAQVRFIEERVNEDGDVWKITTLPGTRLGLLFGMWNQAKLMPQVKAVVVCEGYFNALSLQQAFNAKYSGVSRNPWKFICASGSGVSDHQAEALKVLKERGYKVIVASDTDEAGMKMYEKLRDLGAITHYAFTNEIGKDWNDILKRDGAEALAKLFISSMTQVEDVDKE